MKRLTQNEVISRFKEIHGDKYDYSEVEYVNRRTKVKILCKECNKFFWQTAGNHQNGQGCRACSIQRRAEKRTLTKKEVTDHFNRVHGEGRYLYDKVVYKGKFIKVKIYCTKCKKYFYQTPGGHKSGNGCPDCGLDKRKKQRTFNKEKVIKQFQEIHGTEKYNYDNIKYVNTHTKIKIFCNTCNEFFWQKAGSHKRGIGCPKCGLINSYSPTEYGLRYKESQIYVLNMYLKKENFFKIGITSRGVDQRYNISNFPYEFNVIRTFDMTGYGARKAEIETLKYHKEFQYSPKKNFDGYTECFSKINMEKINEICSFYKNKKVNLIGLESKQFEEFLELVV